VQWVENTFTNLGHLIGETVKVLGTNVDDETEVYDDEVVDASGDITLQSNGTKNWVRKAIAGLPYTFKLQPMRFAAVDRDGTIQGSIVNIHKIIASLYKAGGTVKFGDSMDDLKDMGLTSGELKTGDVELSFDGGYSTENNLIISGNDPLPCTVRSIIAFAEKTGQ
jgi:hypothetical protein